MLTVTDVEDEVLDVMRADTALAGYVRAFEPVTSLDVEELRRAFPNFPAIGIISPRGEYSYLTSVQEQSGLFSVLCMNRNLRSRVAAIRGGASGEVGLWDMVEDCRRILYAGLPQSSGILDCLPTRRYLVYAGEALSIAAIEAEIKWRN